MIVLKVKVVAERQWKYSYSGYILKPKKTGLMKEKIDEIGGE
jgi:hypothetical protein